MELSPYFKLMSEKNSSELSITVGSPVIIKIAGKEKPVGKTAVTAEMVIAAASSLMSEPQKKQFTKNKLLEFVYSNSCGEFNVKVYLKQNNIGIVIQSNNIPTKNKEAEKTEPKAYSNEIPLLDSKDLLDYLKIVIEKGASDLFICASSQIKIKLFGKFIPLSSFIATPEITQKCTYSVLNDKQITQFEQTKDLDFAITMSNSNALVVTPFSSERLLV